MLSELRAPVSLPLSECTGNPLDTSFSSDAPYVLAMRFENSTGELQVAVGRDGEFVPAYASIAEGGLAENSFPTTSGPSVLMFVISVPLEPANFDRQNIAPGATPQGLLTIGVLLGLAAYRHIRSALTRE